MSKADVGLGCADVEGRKDNDRDSGKPCIAGNGKGGTGRVELIIGEKSTIDKKVMSKCKREIMPKSHICEDENRKKEGIKEPEIWGEELKVKCNC